MELFTLSAAARSAAVAWQVGEALYHLIRDTNAVNQTVIDLHASTVHLGIVCDSTAKHVQYLGASPSRDDLQIFDGIEMVLKRCDEQMRRLSASIDGVRKEHHNFIGQMVRQIRLNLSDKDIRKCKECIESDVSKLNHFLVILIHKDLRQSLGYGTGSARPTSPSRRTETAWPRVLQSALTRAPSPHNGSIGGSTVTGNQNPSADNLMFTSKYEDNDQYDHSRMGSPSASTYAANFRISRNVSLDKTHDPATESARRYLLAGDNKFKDGAFAEARNSLRKALVETRALETRHPEKFVDLAGVQYKLAVCSYHLEDTAAAEAALGKMFGKQPTSHIEGQEICHAGHLLALLYARTSRVDRAASTCESIYWKQKEVFGRDHPACFESLALLSLCYEELGRTSQAELCMALVPSSEQERLRYDMSLTLFYPKRKCVDEGSVEYLPAVPRCLQWSADNSCLGWQYGDYNITVYSAILGHRYEITSPWRRIEAFALSPFGDRVVLAARSTNKFFPDSHALLVHNVNSGRLVQQLRPRHVRTGVTGIAFSPDSKSIVVTDGMGLLEVLTVDEEPVVASGKFTLRIQDRCNTPRFSPRGHEIVVGHHNGVIIQPVRSDAVTRSISLENESSKGGWTCSPNGQHLALATSAEQILLLETHQPSNKQSFSLPCPARTTLSAGEQDIAFLPNGTLVVARYVGTGENRGLTVYDVQNSRALILDDDLGGFEMLKFSSDGTYLSAVAKSGSCIKFWNVAQVILQF